MNYWLMKNEPETYSINDLMHEGSCVWEGVRNYQARNFMRSMKVEDMILFYHSNANPSGIAGVAKIGKEAYPDPTQFDNTSEYFDPKAAPQSPRWSAVDLVFVSMFPKVLSLQELKADAYFADMMVTRKGIRLSVQPVSKKHFDKIVKKQTA